MVLDGSVLFIAGCRDQNRRGGMWMDVETVMNPVLMTVTEEKVSCYRSDRYI